MTEKKEQRPWLIQLYFVLASLIGLILLLIGSVGVTRLLLLELAGVGSRPEFTAPYPPYKDPNLISSQDPGLTQQQQQMLTAWEQSYAEYLEQEQALQQSSSSLSYEVRRQLVEGIAYIIVGLPVLLIHAPFVFRKT